ncbi:MAG: peptidoglycan DD-metalloendopeptidase family protein, partial [Nanoarchaeota archaeon]|nr:peptidoglycan DD-metalloendopeptidase family protein [Nanoarchaeota archaeon]
ERATALEEEAETLRAKEEGARAAARRLLAEVEDYQKLPAQLTKSLTKAYGQRDELGRLALDLSKEAAHYKAAAEEGERITEEFGMQIVDLLEDLIAEREESEGARQREQHILAEYSRLEADAERAQAELRKERDEATVIGDKARAKVSELAADNRELTDYSCEIENELDAARRLFEVYTTQHNELEERLREATESLQTKGAENDQLNQGITQIKEALATKEGEAAQYLAQKEDIERQLAEARTANTEAGGTISRLFQKLHDAKGAAITASQEAERYQAQLKEAETQRADIQNQLDESQKNIISYEADILELQRQIEELKKAQPAAGQPTAQPGDKKADDKSHAGRYIIGGAIGAAIGAGLTALLLSSPQPTDQQPSTDIPGISDTDVSGGVDQSAELAELRAQYDQTLAQLADANKDKLRLAALRELLARTKVISADENGLTQSPAGVLIDKTQMPETVYTGQAILSELSYSLPVDKNLETFLQDSHYHRGGIRIAPSASGTIISIQEGIVRDVDEARNGRKRVMIEHENGLISYYDGLDTLTVNEGDFVSKGKIIGHVDAVTGQPMREIAYRLEQNGEDVHELSWFTSHCEQAVSQELSITEEK